VDLVVEGETGFLCEPSPEGIVPKLTQLIESAELRVSMGRNGRARVKKEFRLDYTVRRTEELYALMSPGAVGASPAIAEVIKSADYQGHLN
jgi:glycosyltransferase involved in cell wall biosynthesis